MLFNPVKRSTIFNSCSEHSTQYLHTQQYNIIYVYLFSTLPVHVCFVFRLLRLPNPSPVNRILWRLHFHEQLKQTKINTETKHENSIHHHDIFEYTTLNMKLMCFFYWFQGGTNCWLFIGTSYFIHVSYIFWPKISF